MGGGGGGWINPEELPSKKKLKGGTLQWVLQCKVYGKNEVCQACPEVYWTILSTLKLPAI